MILQASFVLKQAEFSYSACNMSNIPIFEWTSRYGDFLENEIDPLLQHGQLCFFASPFIQYQSLKEFLLNIKPLDFCFDTISATSASNMSDDCCICLEHIDQGSDLVLTRCKHCFHSSCILKVIDHAEHHLAGQIACPLCRSPDICTDPRRDRAIVDFARAIESNLRAAERCHLSLMHHAQLRLRMLGHEAAALTALSRLLGGARLRVVRREAAALRDLLNAAALLSAAGREGFRALLREFDARRGGAGSAASAAASRVRAAARRFAADSAPAGPIEAAIAAIVALDLQLAPPDALPTLPALSDQQMEPAPPAPQPAALAPAAPCSRWSVRGAGARGWRGGATAAAPRPSPPQVF